MSQLVEWLGLPLQDINTEVKLSRTIGSAMYISKIPKDLVAKLNNFYKPHNERLFQVCVSEYVCLKIAHTTLVHPTPRRWSRRGFPSRRRNCAETSSRQPILAHSHSRVMHW